MEKLSKIRQKLCHTKASLLLRRDSDDSTLLLDPRIGSARENEAGDEDAELPKPLDPPLVGVLAGVIFRWFDVDVIDVP